MRVSFKLLLCVLLLASSVLAKTERPSRLVIKAPRTTYAVAEPLVLAFSLHNDRKRAIRGEYAFTLESTQLVVTYQREGEQPHAYATRSDEDPTSANVFVEKVRIPARSKIKTEGYLLYDKRANRFVFEEPGVYRVRATFHYVNTDYSKTIESNTLRITVLPLPKDESKAALALWKDADLAKTVQGNLYSSTPEQQQAIIERLRELVEKFPASIYAKAAKAAIVSQFEERERRGQPALTDFEQRLLDVARQQA
jgi:hypothetical protein